MTGAVPSANAGLLVNRFTSPKLDQELLDAITNPPAQCGCYFEANVEGGSAPASCQAGPADCPSDHPACNSGFCEKR